MRKAQIQTQVFIYLLSMIIVGLVLMYGYNAIRGFREKQEHVSMIEFESQLENTIRIISSDYGRLKKEILPVPAIYEMICFVDNSVLGSSSFNCKDISGSPYKDISQSEGIVNNAVEDGTANIFLVPDGTENYKIGNIKLSEGDLTGDLSDGCLCIQKTGSDVIFRVEGMGDGVKITEWYLLTGSQT